MRSGFSPAARMFHSTYRLPMRRSTTPAWITTLPAAFALDRFSLAKVDMARAVRSKSTAQ